MNSSKKNILIGALLVAIIAMSIGYAAMAQQLTISGSANFSDASWSINFTTITLDATKTKGATEVSAPSIVGTTASFDVKLAYPGAKAVYNIEVENAGSIDAVLKTISGVTEANSAEPTGIKYTVDGIAANDTLDASQKKQFTVTVEWLDTDTIPTTNTSKTATIYLNYEQAK